MSARAIVGTTATILAGDAIWLTLRRAYHNQLFQSIQQSPIQFRWFAAIPVYALFVFALYQVAILPAGNLWEAARRGAIVGGVMYAFYDFTNFATFTNWTMFMTVSDALWGAAAGAMGAAVGRYLL